MTSIVTIQSTDLITNSRADINLNFLNLNNGKIETSWVDTDPTLAANSNTRIPTQAAVKAYVDTGGNVNASTTQKGIVEQATAAEIASRATTGGTGAALFINPGDLGSVLKFGGTGADGAFSRNSGTETVNLGSAAYFEMNYTSFSLTGTGNMVFTNPHANGTIIVFKATGNVTITTSATRAIDLRGLGALGALSDHGNGTDGYGNPAIYGGGLGTITSSGGIGGLCNMPISGRYGRSIFIAVGGGGGAGTSVGFGGNKSGGGGGGAGAKAAGNTGTSGSTTSGGTGSVPGFGGRGAGGFLFEVGGALNITGTIDASGSPGVAVGDNFSSGGGGGGAGSITFLYTTLTADTGTYTVTGGVGSVGGTSFGTGGDGGIGVSLVAKNTFFA